MFFHRHIVLHLLINLGLRRLHLLVAKTPPCISLKWSSFYFKTLNYTLFSPLVCPSEHQHSQVEMSDITENFFKSHFITHIEKEKEKRKKKKERQISCSFSFLQSVLDLWYCCPWFLCLCLKWIPDMQREHNVIHM